MDPSESRPSHLVFACGSSWYAVPADCASEVVTFPALTRVPGAPAHLLGVFAHRGEVIPVIDLSVLTGGASEGGRRAILLRVDKGVFALTASQVAGVSWVTGGTEPVEAQGVKMHLRGPAQAAQRDVAVVEPHGLFQFLTEGG